MTDLERRALSAIDLDVPWGFVETLSGMEREHPDDVNRAVDLLVERLRHYGVPVTVHEPELFLSLPKEASVAADGRTFRAKAPAASASAPDGVEGPLFHVGASYARNADDVFGALDASDETKRAIAGKIVVSEGYANPSNVSKFEEWGAIAVIAINPGEYVHWGTCTTVWGIPDLDGVARMPRIPAVNVNRATGDALIELASQGGRATVRTVMEEGWFRSKLPVVELRGTEYPDEFVLLHGHIDSWDVGVGDNATGDATMLEVARVLHRHQNELKRSVRIAWWPGHSTGRYAGSTWYADAFGVELHEGCVVQLNCDSPGCRWATEYTDVSHTAETASFASRVIREVTGKVMQGARAHQAGDYSFNNIGISGHFMLLSTMPDDLRAEKGYYAVGGCGANIEWHTEFDTMQIADRDILLADVKIYLLSVLRHATLDVLDLDWRATTAEFAETLASYDRAAGGRFDFAPAHAALAELERALGDFYDRVAASTIAPRAANAAIRRLARILIPLNFTREQSFWHDPALTIPPLPDLAPALELDRFGASRLGFALTHLQRGSNRFVAALRAARREIDLATSAPASDAGASQLAHVGGGAS
jgi:N-acetylated-alpha-linked acidic dipeptidase